MAPEMAPRLSALTKKIANKYENKAYCQSVQTPLYQSDLFPGTLSPSRTSSLDLRKLWNGAEKTAATSFASSRGIMVSSTLAALFPLVSSECRNATHGRTASAVLARLKGS